MTNLPRSKDSLIVETNHLYKTYHSKVETPVLFDVNLRIQAGEFVAVMGQSGSGKSTLLNILGCLDRPSRGTVHIDGQDIAHLSDDELAQLRRERIGFIFQAHFLLDEFTCLENVLLPVLIQHGFIPVRERERAIALLTRVGLKKELDKTPDEMSGGQNQRIAIVRALANRPSLLLADEPTGNLDSKNGKEVFALMREIGEETGVAVVMVTHDDRLAYEAQRILFIEDGYLTERDSRLSLPVPTETIPVSSSGRNQE